MTVVLQLSDQQASALEMKAAADGLSVEQWIHKIADLDQIPPPKGRTGAELITALQASPYRDVDIEPERYRLPVRDCLL